jgi:hypothetical protein
VIRAMARRALVLAAAFAAALTPVTCLWRKQQAVAGQGDTGIAGRAARAARTEEDAKIFTYRCASLQGRGGARSLEAGHGRPFPDPQDLSDLPVVGRSRAEVVRGRPTGSGRVLYNYA